MASVGHTISHSVWDAGVHLQLEWGQGNVGISQGLEVAEQHRPVTWGPNPAGSATSAQL